MATSLQFTSNDPDAIRVPLDESLYKLDDAEVAFFCAQTGIQDSEELKQHILAVQKEAYAIHPYPCILRFHFAKLKMYRLFAYQRMLKLGRDRPGALFLELGCCVGTDVRKAIADGFPADQAIASDLHPEFWDIGHKLYKSTPESFPVRFIAGDATDPTFLAPATIPPGPSTDPVPDLRSLTSLTPLVGRLSIIYASSFFHLFDEPTQLTLAKRLAALLLPEPGSMIFGLHVGSPEKGTLEAVFSPGAKPSRMFCHSPESWTDLWQRQVFSEGQVEMKTVLREIPKASQTGVLGQESSDAFYVLIWSVTRV